MRHYVGLDVSMKETFICISNSRKFRLAPKFPIFSYQKKSKTISQCILDFEIILFCHAQEPQDLLKLHQL